MEPITVNALVAMGVHVVGAAGNENVDACTESPRWVVLYYIGLLVKVYF